MSPAILTVPAPRVAPAPGARKSHADVPMHRLASRLVRAEAP
jgi:hypothetical protein